MTNKIDGSLVVDLERMTVSIALTGSRNLDSKKMARVYLEPELNRLAREFSFDKINTLTKYPSIFTYHALDRGICQEELNEGVDFNGTDFSITEKLDGTNARIVIYGDDYFIGSREEILYAKGDRLIAPNDLITPQLIDIADNLLASINEGVSYDVDSDTPLALYVFYFEVFGGNIQRKVAVNYTKDQDTFGVRLFDVTTMDTDDLFDVLELPIENISSYRERNRTRFTSIGDAKIIAEQLGLEYVPEFDTEGVVIPTERTEVLEWLQTYSDTKVKLDGSGLGKSEGIIIKSADNQLARKIRFEDYERLSNRLKK